MLKNFFKIFVNIFIFTSLLNLAFAAENEANNVSDIIEKNSDINQISVEDKPEIIAQNFSQNKCSDKYSALVFNDENNHIIFENRADEIIYPASLTKVMTAYLVFEALEKNHLNLQQFLTISANAEDVGRVNKVNTLGLKEGDKIMVEDALKGMLIKSFNETAVALAEAISEDEWHFAQLMNAKAAELKMKRTNFRNASGLHEEGHYTTLYDLARLVKAIEKKFPQYRKYFALKEFNFNKTKYKNTNHVLLDYKGADGFKTGYTNAAGFNLIASAKKDDIRITSILTGCESYKKRDESTTKMLDNGFKTAKENNSELIVTLK